MKNIKIVVLCFLIGSLFGCSKDNEDITPPATTLLVKRVSTKSSVTYTYDSQNRISGYSYVDNTDNTQNSTASILGFNANNQVTEIVFTYLSGDSYRYANTYNSNGKIDKVEIYSTPSGGTETHTGDIIYTYSSGEVSVSFKSYPSGSVVLSREIFIDANNNITKENQYNPAGTAVSYIYEYTAYDNKKNPQSLIPNSFISDPVSANNPLTMKVTDYWTGGGSVTTTNFSYEYDSEGYTVKMITPTNTNTYTYEKR